MKTIQSIIALGLMASMTFMSCSKDDDVTQPTPTPTPVEIVPTNPIASSSWKLLNSLDPTTTTIMVIGDEKYIDWSATNTTQNQTIPEGTPTYSKETKPLDQAQATQKYNKEWGYCLLPAPIETKDETGQVISSEYPSSGDMTYWPQSVATSTDGTIWSPGTRPFRADYKYEKNGIVLILTKGDQTNEVYYDSSVKSGETSPTDAFFKTWTKPIDPSTQTQETLVMSAEPYQDYSPAIPTNPTIPADAPSFVITQTISYGLGVYEYIKDMGYFTIPAAYTIEVPDETATSGTTDGSAASGTTDGSAASGATDGNTPSGETQPKTKTITVIPSKGLLTLWTQKQMTSTDGSIWNEITPAQPTMRQFNYELIENVMLLTGAEPGSTVSEAYYTDATK